MIKKLDNKKCIFVLGLGGTISCQSGEKFSEFYDSPSINIQELISSLLLDEKKIEIKSEQFLNQISHDMTNEDLISVANKISEIANDTEVDGIVVTQGTNCIEETAYFISLVINTKKNIVFTGSFRHYGSLGFDGGRNLLNAITLASNNKLCGLGVLLTFNDCIVSARDAIKINPSIMGDLTANHMGHLGTVIGDRVEISKNILFRHTFCSEFSINRINYFPSVCIIYGYLGMDSLFVNAAIKAKLKGIISAGVGKGYQSKTVTNDLYKASKKGILIVRCSRTGQGIVNRDGQYDDKYDFIAGGSLSPQKARILLSVAMIATNNRLEIQRVFDEY